MSRSHKKVPVVTIRNKKGKHYAKRKVRRTSGIISGCHYKRFYESYDIVDYRWFGFEEVRLNKLFRHAAKLVRKFLKGKLDTEEYDLFKIYDTLRDYKNTFDYINK